MRKIFLLVAIAVAIVMAVAPQATAYSVTVNWYPGYQSGSGGEFTLTPKDGLEFVLPWYDPKAKYPYPADPNKSQLAFESFCLEKLETVTQAGTYNAVLNNSAVWGGVGPGGDPISQGTAWLYEQFAEGTLAGYIYTVGAARIASAGALQNTIWWLEGEIAARPDNIFTTAVEAKLADPKANNEGKYHALVLNLTKRDGSRAQDQLIYWVPEPGTLLLLGLGLLSIAGVRRKL